jgi:hypothetical protein
VPWFCRLYDTFGAMDIVCWFGDKVKLRLKKYVHLRVRHSNDLGRYVLSLVMCKGFGVTQILKLYNRPNPIETDAPESQMTKDPFHG